MSEKQQINGDTAVHYALAGFWFTVLQGVRYLSMVLIVASLLMATLPWVYAAVDPTAPMVFDKKPTVKPRSVPGYTLSSLLFSERRKLAVINGRLLAEGDRVAGALVRTITKGGVELVRNNKTIFLKLPQASLKSPARIESH